MVQFEDGSVKAQLGLPDMRIPIRYALTYPFRVKSDFPRINFGNNLQLTFERPDTVRFPNLALAREALERGGNMPCVLNAANEVAVEGFLEQSIGFMQMSEIIAEVMSKSSYIAYPSLDDYKMTDIETRLKTAELISQNLA